MDAAGPGTATRPPPSHQDTSGGHSMHESVDMIEIIERTRTSWRYLQGGGLLPSGARSRRAASGGVGGGWRSRDGGEERERRWGKRAVNGGR